MPYGIVVTIDPFEFHVLESFDHAEHSVPDLLSQLGLVCLHELRVF